MEAPAPSPLGAAAFFPPSIQVRVARPRSLHSSCELLGSAAGRDESFQSTEITRELSSAELCSCRLWTASCCICNRLFCSLSSIRTDSTPVLSVHPQKCCCLPTHPTQHGAPSAIHQSCRPPVCPSASPGGTELLPAPSAPRCGTAEVPPRTGQQPQLGARSSVPSAWLCTAPTRTDEQLPLGDRRFPQHPEIPPWVFIQKPTRFCPVQLIRADSRAAEGGVGTDCAQSFSESSLIKC